MRGSTSRLPALYCPLMVSARGKLLRGGLVITPSRPQELSLWIHGTAYTRVGAVCVDACFTSRTTDLTLFPSAHIAASSSASPPSSQASRRRGPREPRELGANACGGRARQQQEHNVAAPTPPRAAPRESMRTVCTSLAPGGAVAALHAGRCRGSARRERQWRASRHRLWARRSLTSAVPHGASSSAPPLA